MTTHYHISPSSTHRIIACPGSLRLAAGLGGRSSTHADEGTLAHSLAARILLGETDLEIADAEMKRHVWGYVTFCIEASEGKWIREYIEKTIESKQIEGFGGTPDYVVMYEENENVVLHVIDFKYGAGIPVGVEQNPQLLSYLLLTNEQHGLADIYRATIYQPRTSGEAAETCDYTYPDLQLFRSELLAAISEGKKDCFDAGDWCRWCPAMPVCDHLHQISIEAAQEAFAPVEEGDDEVAKLTKLLKHKPAIEKLLKEIPKRCLALIESGKAVPGWKAVQGLGNRSWRNDEATTLKKLARRKIGKRLATVTKMKSPTQLDRDGFGDEIKDLYHRPTLGPTLVRESDKRPALEFETPAESFGDVSVPSLDSLLE